MSDLPELPEPDGAADVVASYKRGRIVLDGKPAWSEPLVRRIVAAAVAKERERCALIAALHSQYPITTEYDKGYAKARSDTAAAIRATPTEPKP